MGKRKATNKLIIGSLVFFLVVGSLWGLSANSSDMSTVYAASKGKVYLKKTSGTVKQGKTLKLTIKKQKGVKIVKKTFTSSKKKVATVSSSGKIKGVKPGKATIKAKVTYKLGKNAKQYKKTLKYTVKVEKKGGSTSDSTTEDANTTTEDTSESDTNTIYPVTIKPDQDVYTVKEGETIQLSATVTRHPKNPNQAVNLEWSGVNSNFIEVTKDGLVSAYTVTASNGINPGVRVNVKDTISGATAACWINITEGEPYVAKYDYDVVMLNDLYIGGNLGSHNWAERSYVYVKTDNPGDRYFGFDISYEARNKIYFGDSNANTYDLNYTAIKIKNPDQRYSRVVSDAYTADINYLTAVSGGYLKTLHMGLSYMDGTGVFSWETWDEELSKRIYNDCNGKITLNLYEYSTDPNVYHRTSDTHKRALVWSKEVELHSFYDELAEWITEDIVPAALEMGGYSCHYGDRTPIGENPTDYEKFCTVITYLRDEIFTYPDIIYVDDDGNPISIDELNIFSRNQIAPLLISSYAGPLWEHRHINSEGSPLLAVWIGELMGYPVESFDVLVGEASGPLAGVHAGVRPLNREDPQEWIQSCPNGASVKNVWYAEHLPERHDIDYFLELFGKK